MEKLKKCFEAIGFSGETLDKVLHAFIVKDYKKNYFFVEEGKVILNTLTQLHQHPATGFRMQKSHQFIICTTFGHFI